MGDHDHGTAGFVEPPDQVQYGDLAAIVQPGGRFIQDEDLGVSGQHRRHGELLPFSPGQVEGVLEIPAGQAGFGQGSVHSLPDLFFGEPIVPCAEGDFVPHGIGEDLMVRILEYESDAASQFGQGPVGGGFAQDPDLALRRNVQSVEMFGERRLAAAVLSHQRDEFAGRDVQADPVHGRRSFAVSEDQVFDVYDRPARLTRWFTR